MGNTASAITRYPLKAGVRRGGPAGEGVMVIPYFLQGGKLRRLPPSLSASRGDLSLERESGKNRLFLLRLVSEQHVYITDGGDIAAAII